jgi:sugar phosphate isomerase/epimerase
MDVVGNLGVQSYCFRGFKENRVVADLVRQCGLTKIELCAVHADFTDEKGFADIVDIYTRAGVDIVSIGVQTFQNDEATERKFFEFAERAGAKVITADFAVDSVPASFRTAERLADRYDIRVAIHNHGGRHWLGSATMLGNVFSNTSERIGLCLDTAWALDSGEDPLGMAKAFSDRLHGVHLKDFVFDSARKPTDVIAGEGNLKLGELLTFLREAGFGGPAVIEYEGDVENPVPAIKQCVAAIRREA